MLAFLKDFYLIYKNFILGLFNFLLASFIIISIVSYNELDPSFSLAGNNLATNIFGIPGAYFSDIMIQYFGLSSLILGINLLIWACKYWIGEEVKYKIIKIISLFLAVTSFSSLLAIYNSNPDNINLFYGGAIGLIIKNYFLSLLDIQYYIFSLIAIFVITIYFAFSIHNHIWSKMLILVFNVIKNFFKDIKLVICKLCSIFKRKEKITPQVRIIAKQFDDKFEDDYEEEKFEETIQKEAKTPTATKNVTNQTIKKNNSNFILPSVTLLSEVKDKKSKNQLSESQLNKNCEELKTVLEDFGVNGEIIAVHPGPVVTLYELEPAAGTKSSRIIGLSDDIARYMRAISARIAVISGRNAIGIELPNKNREIVYLREMLESEQYKDNKHSLPIILGKDISGAPIVVDLAKMPHLLVAGTTGSGKSVAINTMILSLLYKLTPDQCKFIMIDPKMLELSVYDDIPHLITPVVTEPNKAITALKWVVKEMENRYRLMSNLGVRNIYGYNERIKEAISKGERLEKTVQTGFDPEMGKPIFEKVPFSMELLPFIVVIVDEMADLMLVAGKDIETSIQRLAQMARAAGIHIIMATQRPSVDVITGVIKANFPTRISFQVTSRIDSRTILGEQGAENLLGMGDMLYMAGGSRITRIHGPYVADNEVEKIVNHLKDQAVPTYIEEVTIGEDSFSDNFDSGEGGDDLYRQAVELVIREQKASTSFIQRCLKIGYNRAATIIEKMEREGVVSKANHVGKREILL